MMANPTFKMLLLLAELTVLVAGNEIKNETTSTVSPKVEKMSPMSAMSPMTTVTKVNITTMEPTPPLAAVMDLFQAPLAAFKPKMAPKHPDEKTYAPMGRAEGTTAAPSNIFFRAGSNLGSAAQSLTGWFNNRMIPQALRPASSTTPQPKPQVIHIISNPQIKRKEMAPQQTLKKPKTNRKKPVKDQSQDFEDIEESVNDENDDDIDEDEENFNLNQDLIDNDEEGDEDYDQVRNRKGSRQTRKRPNQQYFYIEEEIDGDDDFDYEVQMPARKPQRKQQQQQQQNFPNRRRKNSKKQQMKRKPMKQGQRPQRVQIVNRPGAVQNQVKRKRRPAASFELVPISQNQAVNLVSTKKKPNAPAQNNNRPLTQFFNIPWSRLGLAGPPKEPSSNNEKEQKPIIVRIPSQQNQIKRKRRPTKKPVNSMKKRKPAKGQFQDQAPVFSVLSEQQIREIFNNQANQQQPLKVTPQLANLPVTLNGKKKPVKNESEDMPSEDSNNNENEDNNNESEVDEKPQAESEAENDKENNNAYIYVGPANDDKEIDLDLYRHYNSHGDLINGRSSSRRAWEEDEYDEDDYDEE